jgi:hypothetical protein
MASYASAQVNLLGSVLAYLGLLAAAAGAVSVAKPLDFLFIESRIRGAELFAAGLALAVLGILLPAATKRLESPRTQLHAFLPAFQFNEFHELRIRAPKERVDRAIREVTADDIALFRFLTRIRRFGGQGIDGILNPPAGAPILEVATRTSFLTLAEIPGREIVLGTLVAAPRGFKMEKRTPEAFRALDGRGFAKAAMNFLLEVTEPGVCLLSTETRVYATDAATRRRFAAYWRVIYPGSALIRIMWLRAIRHRAEATLP